MPGTIIIGLVFGDEGKGKVCDYFAKDVDIGVRFNGSCNAGHTIIVNGTKYVTHLVPATALYPHKTSVIGPAVALDMRVLVKDIENLSVGAMHNPLYIDDKCPIIQDHHRQVDSLPAAKKIGTTGRGVGPCYADQVLRVGSRYRDLLDLDTTRKSKPVDTSKYIRNRLWRGKEVLFEGAQGTFLDLIHGTYPYVTGTSTLSGAVYSTMGVDPKYISKVIGVFKAYSTRVGNGPFLTEETDPEKAEFIRESGGEYGATTGRPRRVGWLDLVDLKLACQLNAVTSLVMTKSDVLSGMGPIKVAVDRKKGKPVYKEFEGWSGDLTKCNVFYDLPKNLRIFMSQVERSTGKAITLISTGPERHQMCKGG